MESVYFLSIIAMYSKCREESDPLNRSSTFSSQTVLFLPMPQARNLFLILPDLDCLSCLTCSPESTQAMWKKICALGDCSHNSDCSLGNPIRSATPPIHVLIPSIRNLPAHCFIFLFREAYNSLCCQGSLQVQKLFYINIQPFEKERGQLAYSRALDILPVFLPVWLFDLWTNTALVVLK